MLSHRTVGAYRKECICQQDDIERIAPQRLLLRLVLLSLGGILRGAAESGKQLFPSRGAGSATGGGDFRIASDRSSGIC